MTVVEFADKHKYKILLILVLLLLWRVFTQNLFLIVLIFAMIYFFYTENY